MIDFEFNALMEYRTPKGQHRAIKQQFFCSDNKEACRLAISSLPRDTSITSLEIARGGRGEYKTPYQILTESK